MLKSKGKQAAAGIVLLRMRIRKDEIIKFKG